MVSSSARVSTTQAATVAAGDGAMEVGGGSTADGGESAAADDDVEESEEIWGSPLLALDDDSEEAKTGRFEVDRGGAAASFRGLRCNALTLFVDGIEEEIGYHHIRGLFSLFGTLSRVFVQRYRKFGRRFRFGFVHFLSRKQASSAIDGLDGLRVGGSLLSVAPARFPRVQKQPPVPQAARVPSSTGSGRGLGSVEVEMHLGLVRGCFLGDCTPSVCLFPEIEPRVHVVPVAAAVELSSPGLLQLGGISVLDAFGAAEIGEGSDLGSSCREELRPRFSLPSPLSQPSPPKEVVKAPRPRGRPKKTKEKENEKEGQSTICLLSKTADGSEVMTTSKELMVLSEEFSNPYGVMTRARSAIQLGKRLGLRFACPDVVAEGEVAAQILARRLG